MDEKSYKTIDWGEKMCYNKVEYKIQRKNGRRNLILKERKHSSR